MTDRWPAYERPGHPLALSVLVITLRVLAITPPVLVMAVLAAILRGGGADGPDLARLLFI